MESDTKANFKFSSQLLMDSLLSVIPCFAITLLVLLLPRIYQIYKASKSSSNLPPGRSWWPIIGETFDFVLSQEKFIRDRMTKLSPDVFQTCLVGERMAVFCGPSANKFLFANENKLVKSWWPRSITDPLFRSGIHHDSSSWKLVREVSLKFLRLDSLERYVAVMDTMVCDHFDTFWAPFNEVTVHPLSKELTLAGSCQLLFKGSNLTPELLRDLVEPFMLWADGILTIPINLPGTSYRKALKRGKLVTEKITHIIRHRKMAISSMDQGHSDKEACVDLLAQLLMASDKEGSFAKDEDIALKLLDFLFASFSSTSCAMTSVVRNLAEHPQVYEKVLQEQLEIAQSKVPRENLNWADIKKMTYSWNTVCESMRLTPPLFGGGFKEVIADFTFAGFNIPKGWKVHWTSHSTNKDPKYFPDPEKFDPGRFEGKGPLPFTFIPFGGGPRMCKGIEYARIQILVFLYRLVTRFRLKNKNPHKKITRAVNHQVSIEGLRICLQPHHK